MVNHSRVWNCTLNHVCIYKITRKKNKTRGTEFKRARAGTLTYLLANNKCNGDADVKAVTADLRIAYYQMAVSANRVHSQSGEAQNLLLQAPVASVTLHSIKGCRGDGCRRGCQSAKGPWSEQKAGGSVTQP